MNSQKTSPRMQQVFL